MSYVCQYCGRKMDDYRMWESLYWCGECNPAPPAEPVSDEDDGWMRGFGPRNVPPAEPVTPKYFKCVECGDVFTPSTKQFDFAEKQFCKSICKEEYFWKESRRENTPSKPYPKPIPADTPAAPKDADAGEPIERAVKGAFKRMTEKYPNEPWVDEPSKYDLEVAQMVYDAGYRAALAVLPNREAEAVRAAFEKVSLLYGQIHPITLRPMSLREAMDVVLREYEGGESDVESKSE